MVNKVIGATVYSAMEVGYTLKLKINPRGVDLHLAGLSDDSIILGLLNTTISSELVWADR